MGGEGRGASPSQSGWELGGERSEGTTPIFHLFVNSFDFVYITLEKLTILPLSFFSKTYPIQLDIGYNNGGGRVFRQTEIARKMVGKTEIVPKPAAAGNGN